MTDAPKPPENEKSPEKPSRKKADVIDFPSELEIGKNSRILTTVNSVRLAASEIYNAYRRQLRNKKKWTPGEVMAMSRVIDLNRKLVVEADLEKRVEELERTMKGASA